MSVLSLIEERVRRIGIRFSMLLLASIALGACSSGEDELLDEPEPSVPSGEQEVWPITISTVMENDGYKRVTDYAFEAGDAIGLYVVSRESDGTANPLQTQGNHVDNMRFTYSGVWTADTPVYWKDDVTHADFYLYYPYRATVGNVETMSFQVNADQSREEAYKASDLVLGQVQDVAPTESAVRIAARHMLTQMVITVVPGNGFTAESIAAADVAVRINGVRTEASVNLAAATVTAVGEPGAVTPLSEDGRYKALIVPQTVSQGNLVTVTVDGREFNYPTSMTFESGRRYQVTVTLNKTSNGINVSIDPWEDDGIDYGGVAE